jgi:hypothetical protein
LHFVAGRQADVVDMLRLGRFVGKGNGITRKPRSILVKLQVAWDNRIVRSSAENLNNTVGVVSSSQLTNLSK